MRRPILTAAILLVLWMMLVGVGARYGWLRQESAPQSDSAGFVD